ncbi:family 78 glycoside hydrolase catalytic domain [Microbacterium sp. ISL-103]|uniref:family 78 glycoside hydrolase catalytic domain n=1 Tax=Microbacterium sp. ISL-103 TaxID=2819156 RepID=UPI001BEC31D9|nr:family 78 glycoside hydrolase catalytic domain [Microbacterium sp. ISL-103]MBT2476316.1 family 78 glycoside hydrolase catalytic domain [Microbacterium sp. ISL-103]
MTLASNPSSVPTAPYDLRIDSGGDEFTVCEASPRLSFTVPVGAAWTGFELEAIVDGERRALVPLAADTHLFVEWPWLPLSSGQRVRWRARATSGDTLSEWSEWASFECGLLDADWTAEWISPVEHDDPGYGARGAHTLAHTFGASGIVSARLYSTALGVYEARINGERVGTAELSPGSTSYDRTLYAQAADVTRLLTDGTNSLEIELSDGWYRGQVGAFRLPAGWGTTLAARAELHLELADGTRQVVGTDQDWTTAGSTVIRADLMDGQTTDFRAGGGAREPVIVGAVAGPPISWSPAPPVRVVETRDAVNANRLADDTWVLDFGQNASGWLRLTDLGPAATRTVIDYGEYVGPDGDVSTAHLDSTKPGEPDVVFVQHDEVVSDGGGAVFEPRLTVHGFQFVRITRQGAPFDPASARMQVVQTDLRRTASFESSDPDLNRLHEIADWSFRGNAVDVPTDCPTRERLAWTGDYQVFAPTAARLYDVLGFTRKWLQSVRDDQLDDGRIANFSPDGRRIKHKLDDQFAMMTGSSGWGDAITFVPWEMYTAYGDARVLEENWDAMVRWVEWELGAARANRHHSRVERSAEPLPHEEYLWDGTFHWGEWTEPVAKAEDGSRLDPIKTNPMAWFMADKGEVGTAYLYRSTQILADAAAVLGRTGESAKYAAIAERVLDAWHSEFVTDDGRTVQDTQAAYVRALSFGLIPESLRATAAQRLVELIRDAGTHLGTGFLSTGDLLPVLADSGHADVAYELLFQRSAPSWMYMIDRGATTIWEDWEGIDDEGVAHESLNHYSKGAVIRFLHTHTLGLRQDADSAAWEAFTIAPLPGGGVSWAKGHLDTPQGRIRVEWRVEGDELVVEADIPAGSRATVVFPDGTTRAAGPGSFAGAGGFSGAR